MNEDFFSHLTDEEQYCFDHSEVENEWLREIARYTWTTRKYPRMISNHLQGRFLSLLSRLKQPTCILEIGTFTGYSALCLAEGLKDHGVLHTIEIDPELEEPLRRFFGNSIFAGQVQLHIGDALQILPSLRITPDIVYIDADKEQYPAYLDICMNIIPPGSLLLADNVLWGGKVLKLSSKKDKETEGIRLFNEKVKKHPRLQPLLLPFWDGFTMAWVK